MFEERIAAMNQRTEEAMAANAVQFDKRTYTVDEIQDILGISRTSAYRTFSLMFRIRQSIRILLNTCVLYLLIQNLLSA